MVYEIRSEGGCNGISKHANCKLHTANIVQNEVISQARGENGVKTEHWREEQGEEEESRGTPLSNVNLEHLIAANTLTG